MPKTAKSQVKAKWKNKHKTKNGVSYNMYWGQMQSSRKRGHTLPTYTLEEFREWLYSQKKFHVMYDNWKRLDYQRWYKPSVDRKCNATGYTMSNIQLMTWRENSTKGNSDHKSGNITYDQRAVIQATLEGEDIAEYNSQAEASRSTQIAQQNISKNCTGERKTAGGFKWRFKDGS